MASPAAQPAQARSGYQELEWIRDADGVIAVLSLRVPGAGRPPLVTMAIFKVYTRNGVEEKTSFFSPQMIPAVNRVLEIAGLRARELETKYQVEFELEQQAKRTGASSR